MNFNRSHTPKHSRSRVGSRALLGSGARLGSRARVGVALTALGVAALIAGCGSSSSSSIGVGNESNVNSVPTVAGEKTPTSTATTPTTATAKTPTSGPLSTQPKVTVPNGAAPTTLVTKEIIKGTGPEAKLGQSVTVNYVGVLYNGGKEFDASWKTGAPATFPLEQGKLIAGWTQGIPGMRVGGRRELIVPAELAYGKPGRPPTIPPNAPLVFVVDLLGT
jgi:FKBP-type peptidyl-prolyl cis-trans isomerase